MFRFFKKRKKKAKTPYDCTVCETGRYQLLDPSKIDQEVSHFYKCDRCGHKILLNPFKNYN